MIWVPVVEYLLLRKLVERITALLAISEGHLWVSKGGQQARQPIGVDRINVSTGYDDKATMRCVDPLIQRVTKGEFLGLDVHHMYRVMGSDFQGAIGGAGIHQDDLMVINGLLCNSVQ